VITIVINAVLLVVSIVFLRKKLHPFEMLTYWLWSSTFFVLFKEIFVINKRWMEINLQLSYYWCYQLEHLIVLPCLTVWLIYFYVSTTLYKIYKWMLTVCWFAVLIGLQFLNAALGTVQFVNWSIPRSLIEWMILLGWVGLFVSGFRKLLKKEAFIT
jgi:hypothetical protein